MATATATLAPHHPSKQASFDFTNPNVSVRADCQKAVDALTRMTDPAEGGSAEKDNAILPVDYLQRCKGLQFVLVRQGGLGVSIARGSGFTIQRLGKGLDGYQQWSAPCFCTIQNVGLGFTVGFNEITSVIVLGSEASVDRLKRTESTAGFDGSLIVGRNSAIDGMAEDGMDAIPFSLADGALLDVSFKGGATMVHKKKNAAVYGPAATADDILDGKIAPPADMQPLYSFLNSICSKPVEPFY